MVMVNGLSVIVPEPSTVVWSSLVVGAVADRFSTVVPGVALVICTERGGRLLVQVQHQADTGLQGGGLAVGAGGVRRCCRAGGLSGRRCVGGSLSGRWPSAREAGIDPRHRLLG